MKYVMLILACFLVLRPESRAATFKSDETAVTLTGRQPGQSWYCHIIRVSDGVEMGSLSKVGGGSFQDGANTVPSVTLSYDFYLLILRYYYTTDLVKVKWISAYEVGNPNEAQQSASGPYADNNTPSNDNGDPVNPATAQPPTNSFKACITIVCPASSLENRSYKITGKVGTSVVYDQIIFLSPGETRKVCVTNTVPFTLTAQEVVSRNAFNPNTDSVGGSDPSDPSQWDPIGPPTTVNSQGQSTPPTSQGPTGTNEKTAQEGSPSQAAAQKNTMSTAGSGATSKDMSDLSNNLSNEIQRQTAQTKASGDAIKSGIDQVNKTLEGMAKGGGTGDAGTGAALGTPSSSGTAFAGSIQGKASGIGAALANLMAAAGLTANPGNNPLTWDVPVMGGTYTVSVEEHANVFQGVRTGILWVAGVFFVWAAFSIVRGAFADEGGK